ncbi:MAG: NUDIX domain-containing protein [Candidatus Thorarchaeota archaeon]
MTKTSSRIWKRLKRRLVYTNPWMTVYEDEVQLPNDHQTIYGFMEPKNEFVGIVPLLSAEEVLLIRQYRYLQDEVTWEIPSGAIDNEETPKLAAQRELQEEVGYKAGQLQLINIMRSNKSLMRDKGYIFLAQGLVPAKAKHDITEEFEIISITLSKAIEMIKQYEITDCVSIIGLLLATEHQKMKPSTS